LEVNNCVDENKVIWRFFIKLSSVLDYNFWSKA
jgi:hypothetical protein